MKSRVVAINALPKSLLLVSRDNHLNARAYQRALNAPHTQPISALVFQPSRNISLQQLMIEKSSRQRVVDMQHQLNGFRSQKAELA